MDNELSLMRMRMVEAKVGIKQTKIYEGIKEGTFPPPVRIGIKVIAWDSREIDIWIKQQIEKSKKIASYKWNGAGKVSKKVRDVQSNVQGGKL